MVHTARPPGHHPGRVTPWSAALPPAEGRGEPRSGRPDDVDERAVAGPGQPFAATVPAAAISMSSRSIAVQGLPASTACRRSARSTGRKVAAAVRRAPAAGGPSPPPRPRPRPRTCAPPRSAARRPRRRRGRPPPRPSPAPPPPTARASGSGPGARRPAVGGIAAFGWVTSSLRRPGMSSPRRRGREWAWLRTCRKAHDFNSVCARQGGLRRSSLRTAGAFANTEVAASALRGAL